jgi:hypothetical protein
LNFAFIAIGVGGGIAVLFFDFANIWARCGLALFMFGWALRHVVFDRTLRRRFGISALIAIRAAWLAYTASGCLLAIALVLRRDAVGWLGLAVCVVWVSLWTWSLSRARALAEVLDEEGHP